MNPALARLLARLGLLVPDRLRILVSSDRLRIETPLLVEHADGIRRSVKFLIDSGCSVTTMGLARAQSLGLSTVGPRAPKQRTGSTGKRLINVVHGSFRFWLSED